MNNLSTVKSMQERIDGIVGMPMSEPLAYSIKHLAMEIGYYARENRRTLTNEEAGWISQLQAYYIQIMDKLPNVPCYNFNDEPFTPSFPSIFKYKD